MSEENEIEGLKGGAGPSEIAEHLKELAQKYRVNKMICRKCYAKYLQMHIIVEKENVDIVQILDQRKR